MELCTLSNVSEITYTVFAGGLVLKALFKMSQTEVGCCLAVCNSRYSGGLMDLCINVMLFVPILSEPWMKLENLGCKGFILFP